MTTARYLKLKPSHPKVQAEREQSILQAKQGRAAAKLRKATTAAPHAHEAVESVQGLPGFVNWYNASFVHSGLLDGLAAHEMAGFRVLARAHYSGTLENLDTWMAALRVLRDRHRDAGIAQEAEYWRARKR
jgi:hypothetical protein